MAKEEKEQEGPPSITPLQQMVSSCSGAVVTSLFVTPLDVVKIRLQIQTKPIRQGSFFIYNNGLMECICICSKCNEEVLAGVSNGKLRERLGPIPKDSAPFTRFVQGIGEVKCMKNFEPWYQRPGHFNGTLDAFVKIARNEGFPALWSGLPPSLVMAIPATVVYFTTYDQLKYKLGYDENDDSTRFIPPISGAVARVVAATIISPIELIRTKMQSEQLSYSHVGMAVRTSIKQNGPLSLMRGLGPTLLRDVPFSGIYWFGYEYSKSRFMQHRNSKEVHFWEAFISGALSGTLAATLTVPFDVIKTHRQIELGQEQVLKKQTDPTTTWRLMHRLYKQRGLSSLFAGLVPRLVKVAPACAIMISSYEYGKRFFRHHNENV
ncbi:hypothetical protein CAPTEDRAFT_151137 [Capitella teleta]|uniref:Solute carrier family 25 member 40 n=1 Tax=Capitella teleta TaxID=283909 RepID=R7UJV6_CAPTE|nr:hypothetical protein CAPTEDRAFT_151137 [Capitella teleta]|eukprot:ELU06485.1 hypothetical protein CAPTEDRAFT_151137 [Capitella teleta]